MEDFHLNEYCVLPFDPLHDFKGYWGGINNKLPSIIPAGTLKRDVNSYLETVFKRAHLYGSDLREDLIEVAHLMVKSNSQSQLCS